MSVFSSWLGAYLLGPSKVFQKILQNFHRHGSKRNLHVNPSKTVILNLFEASKGMELDEGYFSTDMDFFGGGKVLWS